MIQVGVVNMAILDQDGGVEEFDILENGTTVVVFRALQQPTCLIKSTGFAFLGDKFSGNLVHIATFHWDVLHCFQLKNRQHCLRQNVQILVHIAN